MEKIKSLLKLVSDDNRPEAEELISRIMEDQAFQREQATHELNASRLAALNMMEDAVLAKEKLELTQFALDHSADAAIWINPDGSLVYVNESICQSLGYSRGELIRMSVHDIDPDFPGDRWPQHWQELKERARWNLNPGIGPAPGGSFRSKFMPVFWNLQVENTILPLCTTSRNVKRRKQSFAGCPPRLNSRRRPLSSRIWMGKSNM